MAQYGVIMPQAPAHFTHPRLHIRTAQDAHRVFEAVRLGILPLIRRRLSPSERDLLASGQVFVWEEAPTGSAALDEASATTSGLERWTDGRRWSQSRMREPFLFYEEKVQTTPEEKQAKADRRARKASSSDSTNVPSLVPIRRQDRPSKPDGLTKQTYSSFVHLTSPTQSPPPSPRKWHCVAYFSASDWNNLPGVEAYPELRNIAIPEGVYASTKGTGKIGVNGMPMDMGTPPGMMSSVGPTRRPVSRGEHSSGPYGTSSTPTIRARQYSFGSSSDTSSSFQPRSPISTYDSPSSYSFTSHSLPPVPSVPPPQPPNQRHAAQGHHQHRESTSSGSSGSPPTPGFMTSIPSPSSYANSHPSSSRPSFESRHSSNDVMMVDAPTVRTPTRDHPPSHNGRHSSDSLRTGYFATTNRTSSSSSLPHSMHSSLRRDTEPSSSTTIPQHSIIPMPSATPTQGNTKLPSLPSVLGQSWSSSSAGRSIEDSKALGAFRLAL